MNSSSDSEYTDSKKNPGPSKDNLSRREHLQYHLRMTVIINWKSLTYQANTTPNSVKNGRKCVKSI